jgi:hypothetical protein
MAVDDLTKTLQWYQTNLIWLDGSFKWLHLFIFWKQILVFSTSHPDAKVYEKPPSQMFNVYVYVCSGVSLFAPFA